MLFDIVDDADGTVHGVANPGRQNAQIQRGHFDAVPGAIALDGEHTEYRARRIRSERSETIRRCARESSASRPRE